MRAWSTRAHLVAPVLAGAQEQVFQLFASGASAGTTSATAVTDRSIAIAVDSYATALNLAADAPEVHRPGLLTRYPAGSRGDGCHCR